MSPPITTESESADPAASHSQPQFSNAEVRGDHHHHHHHHHPAVHSLHPISLPANFSDDFIHAFSGAAAGLASGVFTCPLDVIKTKLQAQGGFERPDSQNVGRGISRGFRSTATMIWAEEGMRGMYRGLGPIILGYLPTWAVYFTVYEKAKRVLSQSERIHKPWLAHILSAMIAGASSTICTNPIWVVKTRLMAQASQGSAASNHGRAPWHYTGTHDAVRKMYAHEGISAFYSGLGPALLGLTHVAVQFPLYEKFKQVFVRERVGDDGKKKVDLLGILSASCLSKICASSATYPHEVIRTRLQTQYRPNGNHGGASLPAHRRYAGLIQTFKTIYKEEGWRAFYAGMGTNMIRAVPASAMTLVTYELCSTYLMKWKERSINSEESQP